MYETAGSGPKSESCKEPDWEAAISKATKDLAIIKGFKESLIQFISLIGTHSFKRRDSSSSMPELLGTVEFDIMEREKSIERFMKKLEKPQ